jgi:protein-disulfide isomerase
LTTELKTAIAILALSAACTACRTPTTPADGDGDGLTDTGYDPENFDASAGVDAGPRVVGGACPDGGPQPYNNAFSPFFGGEEEVKVNVEVATDFACPYCAAFAVTVSDIWDEKADYRKYVRFYFHHHYLESLHPDSPEIHAISAAVAEQSIPSFWRLHDEIYARRNEGETMTPEDVITWVEAELDLDMALFHEDRQSDAIKSFVAWDKQQGEEAGVSGTPTLFICGRIQPRQAMEELIDGYLYAD